MVFAIARMIGLPGTLTALALTYIFGPAIAFTISRYGTTRNTRYGIATSVLVLMLCIAYSVAAMLVSPTYAIGVVPGTACAWTPQIGFIYLLYAAWKSGLRSAGVEPYAITNSKKTANHRLQRGGGGDRFGSG